VQSLGTSGLYRDDVTEPSAYVSAHGHAVRSLRHTCADQILCCFWSLHCCPKDSLSSASTRKPTLSSTIWRYRRPEFSCFANGPGGNAISFTNVWCRWFLASSWRWYMRLVFGSLPCLILEQWCHDTKVHHAGDIISSNLGSARTGPLDEKLLIWPTCYHFRLSIRTTHLTAVPSLGILNETCSVYLGISPGHIELYKRKAPKKSSRNSYLEQTEESIQSHRTCQQIDAYHRRSVRPARVCAVKILGHFRPGCRHDYLS
jgi:hypothetical protein